MNSEAIGEVGVAEESSRTTPVKRRRLLPLVDLRNTGCGQNQSYKNFVNPGAEACHVMEYSGSASVGSGRKSRPALTDLTKSGFCGIVEGGEPAEVSKTNTLGSATVLTKGISDPKDGTVSRFPRLDQCAHFHYEFVELPTIQVVLVNEDLKPLSQSVTCEDIENKSLLVQVTSLGRSWVVRRTYDNFRFLDKQLHRCCYDRKISHLQELPPEENLPRGDEQNCAESLLEKYLERLSEIAGSLITCGPVLGWLELDNRGHRLIVTDDSDINTPAVAAAYVVKRYTAQASDEISFEVGDMISVIDMPPPEESIWWRGKRGFQVGFFPCECVQVIEGKVPRGIHPQGLTLPPPKRSSINAPSHSSLHAVHSFSTTQEQMKPVLRKHGKLIAFFRSFILSRPPRPWLKRSGILRERVFGCDLAEHLLNSGHDIPMVLKCCSEFIETHGTVDGIYRLSGITSNIQKLRNAFDEERVPALYEDESILQDIHCVSSVLKMYFRELPNPLLTYQLYTKFSQAVIQDEGVRLLHVRDVVQQLPPPHYRTLEYLIRHLARVASFSNTTGMTPKNIAIVWAPNLLRSKDLERGGVAALQGVGTQAVVTEYLVRYVDLIFNDKIPNFSPSSVASSKLPRPKSLAISTPVKLLSIDEARNRSLAAIKTDQNYIDVGGGPNSLPKTYHTVIDIRNRKGGSLKQKKSPIGWKTFFWKNKHQQKKNYPIDNLCNISDTIGHFGGGEQPSKRLRPTKSVESLSSSAAQLHSKDSETVISQEANSLRNLPFIEKERSLSSLSSPTPSSRTHSRSLSHNSYFNLLEKRMSSKISKDFTESESSASPKFDLELKELNIEFKLSESDVGIFSEDDTLRSTSMDTASRTTLDTEGVSLRSSRSPSAHQRRTSRPLKRNLLRSSSEDFKCASLSPSDAAGPDKQYRSSGNIPKYAKLNGETKRASIICDSEARSENPSDFDKSPSRGSFDSALIEPDLLERITRMRTSSVEEIGSDESLSDELAYPTPAVGKTILEPVIRPSLDEVSPPNELESADVDGDLLITRETVLSEALVSDNFELKSDNCIESSIELPSETRFSRMSTMGLPPSMMLSTAIISPETPQSEINFGEIQYDPLSDTTEVSTPSHSDKPDTTTNQISLNSQDVSCDSLSSQYETILVASPSCDAPMPKKNFDTDFPLEVKYETLFDCSPGDMQSNQDDPQYMNVELSATNDSTVEGSNFYENIEVHSESQLDMKTTNEPNYENCEFIGGVAVGGAHSAAVADKSVYQQVKYLRRSIQEVNEILNDNSPQLPEKRKSITKMTIHFSKPAVSTNSTSQVTAGNVATDEVMEHTDDATVASYNIKEISLTELPVSSDDRVSTLDMADKDEVMEYLPTIPEQRSEVGTVERTKPNESLEPFIPIGVAGQTPPLEFMYIDAVEPIQTIENNYIKQIDTVSPSKPIPLPRRTLDTSKATVVAGRVHGSRSLTPPAQVTDSLEHPSTSLPTDLARNSSHDSHQSKTWPPSDQQRNMVCYHDEEDDTEKRERIDKYKEERRLFLRKNYHPSSFKGEKDEMLLRLKQKATSPFRSQEKENFPLIFSEMPSEKDHYAKESLESDSSDSSQGPARNSKELISNRIGNFDSNVRKTPIDITAKSDGHTSSNLPVKSKVAFGKTASQEEVTVKERVAIWTQQKICDPPKPKVVCAKPSHNPLPKSSPILIQEVKDKGLNPVYNNGLDNLHRPCVKSQSSDSIPRSCPSVLPFKSEIASRRSSDVGRKIAVGGVTLKPTRKISSFDPAKITGSIGQDKIRAIAAQFEPDVSPAAKSYLRQISK